MEMHVGVQVFLLFMWMQKSYAGRQPDWLIQKITTETQLNIISTDNLQLSNGLLSRTFLTTPDFSTIDYYSHEKNSSLLRALSPEAVISLDGVIYRVGYVNTSIPRAYLNRTALKQDIHRDGGAFHYVSHSTHLPEAPFKYKPRRSAPKDIVWPPKGLRLDVSFKAPNSAPLNHQKVNVTLHYEMYDGIPLLSKWITISAEPEIRNKLKLGIHSVEYLAVNWQWSDSTTDYQWFHVETDMVHGANVLWQTDPEQPLMPGSFETIVNCTYELLAYIPLDVFTSFQVRELVIASSDPERRGMAKRRMLRLLAPHTQENPIFFHSIHSDSHSVRTLVDQMAAVGFEMLMYSFGSKFDYESDNETYIAQIAADVAYANERGIEVGGYDLIALTRVPPMKEWLADDPEHRPSACFASGWYDYLLGRILNVMNKTGMTAVETDGPYGGYPCSSTQHAHHSGHEDSVYQQNKLQGKFYTILREKEVYIHQPDNYFYQGGSKTGMGYSEKQYSLPRWQDMSVSRQGMFDDTFKMTVTQGWMFLPLTVYHGGGAAAIFEPLNTHLEAYNWGLAQYMGAGVAPCYRGYRLYDSNDTKAIVMKWVQFYKSYRDILTSDIVHVRRPDMQGIDCFMHVNPWLSIKGLAMVFNPTHIEQMTTLTLPLYYTGISNNKAYVSQEAATYETYFVQRDYGVELKIKLPPLGITWYLIKE